LVAWRLNFLADPVPLSTPSRAAVVFDLNGSFMDPAQITATLGMTRDMDLLSRRLAAGAGSSSSNTQQNHAPRKEKGPKAKNKATPEKGES
jgi:hypothetical protein